MRNPSFKTGQTIITLLLAIVLVSALPATALARNGAVEEPREMTVPEIIEAQISLDNTLITFEGEAIGEALKEKDGNFWVNVGSEGTAVGVVVAPEQRSQIKNWGTYKMNGDKVRIVGTLLIADPDHDGSLCVTAETLEVIQEGRPRFYSVEHWQLGAGIALIAAGLLLTAVYNQKRKRVI